MTDERALQIYAESYNAELSWYDDEELTEIANEVRAMLAAPSLGAAMDVIADWSMGDIEQGINTRMTKAMRAKYDADGREKP